MAPFLILSQNLSPLISFTKSVLNPYLFLPIFILPFGSFLNTLLTPLATPCIAAAGLRKELIVLSSGSNLDFPEKPNPIEAAPLDLGNNYSISFGAL